MSALAPSRPVSKTLETGLPLSRAPLEQGRQAYFKTEDGCLRPKSFPYGDTNFSAYHKVRVSIYRISYRVLYGAAMTIGSCGHARQRGPPALHLNGLAVGRQKLGSWPAILTRTPQRRSRLSSQQD